MKTSISNLTLSSNMKKRKLFLATLYDSDQNKDCYDGHAEGLMSDHCNKHCFIDHLSDIYFFFSPF